MSSDQMLITLLAGSTWFMTGLIWFVQVVHYPLMASVGEQSWVDYERSHTRRTTFVVAPVMLAELGISIGLVIRNAAADEPAWPVTFILMNAATAIMVWLSTFALQVPLHRVLIQGFDEALHRRLVWTNWIRTGLWSFRSVLVAAMLLQ